MIPQSWNRYAYALNNPIALVDRGGLDWLQDSRNGRVWWAAGEHTEKEWQKLLGNHVRKLEVGTVIFVTEATGEFKNLKGHGVRLLANDTKVDLGPPEVIEINFWDGEGQRFFAAYLKFAGENVVFSFLGGTVGAAAVTRLGRFLKAVNLPSWRRVAIDMGEVLTGHTAGGHRAIQSIAQGGSKTLFPANWSEAQIERAIREAYRYAEKIRTQGERILVRGEYDGVVIEMWVNRATKTIETAYPVY